MQRILIVLLLVIITFIAECLIFNFFGRIFLPNLSLILIMFINLSLGIRYSLLAAILSGAIKDSLGIGFFGTHMLSFVACAFVAVWLKKYIYLRGSNLSRLVLLASMVLTDFTVQFFLNLMSGEVPIVEAMRFVLIPELCATLLLANLCLTQLKKCVLKFFV